MNRLIVAVALGATLLFASTGSWAANPHSGGTNGQPNKSCEDTPSTPGKSAAARGSAFNSSGISGTHYAGEQAQNSKNPKSVSQYDCACFQQSQH